MEGSVLGNRKVNNGKAVQVSLILSCLTTAHVTAALWL